MSYFIKEYDIERPKDTMCAVLDDSIMHKGQPVTAGSKILEGYISPITATVVTKLEEAGITIVGKAKMCEFGASGLFALESNPALSKDNESNISGAVAIVAEGKADFALCNDYTGAVSADAATKDLYYIHPTYGTISRYGLIPTVPSMDQIGIVCKTLEAGQDILSIISGYDEKDGIMPMKSRHATDEGRKTVQSGSEELEVAIPTGITGISTDIKFQDSSLSCKITSIELPYHEIYKQVMQILCSAELSATISRYDGIKFGFRAKEYSDLEELYKKSRTEAFGSDVKLAAIMGATVLSEGNYTKYYDKAMRIRRLIRDSLDFQKYDAILMPNPYLAKLCGLPAITIPHSDGAITMIANTDCEEILFSILRKS